MTFEISLTLLTIVGVLGLLVFSRVAPDLIMLAAVTLLLTLGVLSPADAFSGFANEGMITVAVLFVVAAGLRETGGMGWVAQRLFGRPKTVSSAQLRMMVPIAAMSSFMNNTPLVATMVPIVADWARKYRIPASKLMMPLSFATILGGLCTLLGTSTNLVVHGLAAEAIKNGKLDPQDELTMFDITPIGVCCAVVGLFYMLIAGRWLLPDRRPAISSVDDAREYTVEMLVEPGSPLVGQSIEQAGLRHLEGTYLMEIDRNGETIPAVGPEQRLMAHDRLVFVGIVDSVIELQRIRGLRPATDQVFKLNSSRGSRCLIEAVVSHTSRVVGQTVRDCRFRTVYNAVVIAVARNGERINRKIGDIELRAGDTLLLEAHPGFMDRNRNSRDFYLVNRLEDSSPPRHERAWVAVVILAAMVALAGSGVLTMLNAALLAAGAMVLTRCCSITTMRRSVDWPVLLVIGAAFGVGKAMEKTGAAQLVAQNVINLAGDNPWAALVMVYGITMLFTELLSNNAAAALVFPFALATARVVDADPTPFLIVIMVAASCGFATPIGYQTNLMVYGPGGYRFSDYVRFGGLLNLVTWAVTVTVTPMVFPFRP
jgi:di/tricarboxylate transporter